MFENSKIDLGVAPIGWTNDDMPDLGKEISFEQCISEMAEAGFNTTEVGNKYPKDPAVLKKALAEKGLKVANAWFSSYLTTKPYEEVEAAFIKQSDFLKAAGAGCIGASEQGHSIQGQMDTPIFDNKYVMNDAEWKLLTEGLNKLGRIANDKGMKLVFHHHMGTVVQTRAETDRLMAETDPELVGLLFDSGHFAYCGEDPLAALKAHIGRVRHVHLKDIRPDIVKKVKDEKKSFLQGVRMGAFTVPGDGCIDFVPIFQTLSDAGYNGCMLIEAEQDPAVAIPLEYAKKGREYIRKTTGL
ncbi:MAG: myo-inosose-2 dehydratase [Planctomycetaceae bacterium]|nr:myo-inosose-2 dehydratase [Planctomycetaceae bacterium]